MTPREFYRTTAWRWCAKYVLLHYSDDDGMVQCSTSPELKYFCNDRKIHVGHYYKLHQHKSLAFEFKNLAPQSYRDNNFFSGKPEVMALWIEKTHGKKTLKWLDREKNKIYKLDKYELKKWSDHYRLLFKKLVKQKGFDPWK